MRRLLPLAAALLVGCLPEDTRPPPAEVLVTFTGADTPVSTADGWTITYSRIWVSIGQLGLSGDDCDEYAGANYFRVLDGKNPEPQKVGLMFGRGTCSLRFVASSPIESSLLGPGVTEADAGQMRVPATDPWQTNQAISYWVEGSAEKGTSKKVFSFRFRKERLIHSDCTFDGATTFPLGESEQRSLPLALHPELLFLDGSDPTKASVRFEPFASADDGDGVLTLDELSKRTLADAGLTTNLEASWKSVGDLLYLGSFPKLVSTTTGTCSTKERTRMGPGGG